MRDEERDMRAGVASRQSLYAFGDDRKAKCASFTLHSSLSTLEKSRLGNISETAFLFIFHSSPVANPHPGFTKTAPRIP